MTLANVRVAVGGCRPAQLLSPLPSPPPPALPQKFEEEEELQSIHLQLRSFTLAFIDICDSYMPAHTISYMTAYTHAYTKFEYVPAYAMTTMSKSLLWPPELLSKHNLTYTSYKA